MYESVMAYNLRPGQIVRDDIACKIVSVVAGEDRTQVLVEDGNGYSYILYYPSDEWVTTFKWSEDDWRAYRDM